MHPSGSVGKILAKKLDIQNIKVLYPLKADSGKLITYIPGKKILEQRPEACFERGCRVIRELEMAVALFLVREFSGEQKY
jgi:hypothetical protein